MILKINYTTVNDIDAFYKIKSCQSFVGTNIILLRVHNYCPRFLYSLDEFATFMLGKSLKLDLLIVMLVELVLCRMLGLNLDY